MSVDSKYKEVYKTTVYHLAEEHIGGDWLLSESIYQYILTFKKLLTSFLTRKEKATTLVPV